MPLSDFITAFEELKSGYLKVREQSRARAKAEAPEYNIFRVLNAARDEVNTHSTFLANLLNPQGSLGQQELFLENFHAYCRSIYADFLETDMDLGRVEVGGYFRQHLDEIVPLIEAVNKKVTA